MVGNIKDQILAHDGQTDETEVATGDNPRRSTDIDAGQTGAIVSPGVLSTLNPKLTDCVVPGEW